MIENVNCPEKQTLIGKDAEQPTMLSVLIPAYNSQDTLLGCIKSVLAQRTNFKFEIIVIDDGSCDETRNIVRQIFKTSQIHRLIVFPKNRGKGAAISAGYREARGKYIQVLDSDDYLIGTSKFQKQISFLENNREYVAIAHNTIVEHSNGEVSLITKQLFAKSFSYEQLMRFEVYFHTSSILFRKISAELPETFQNIESFRGDSAFLYFHVFQTKLSLYFIPEIMSIYSYHKGGIWSKLTPLAQHELNLALFSDLQNFIVGDPSSNEYVWLSGKINYLKSIQPIESIFTSVSIEQLISDLRILAGQVYAPERISRIANETYSFGLVDSLSEGISKILELRYPQGKEERESPVNIKYVVILFSGFSQTEGGIFKEIENLMKIHQLNGFKILLISTEEVESNVVEWPEIFSSPDVEIYKAGQSRKEEKIIFIQNILRNHYSERLYCLFSHHDVVGNCSIFPHASKDIVLHFVYDHISTLGLLNSSINKILCKFESQAKRLSLTCQNVDIILISPYVESIYLQNPFQVASISELNSASGSARSYKIETGAPDQFILSICSILERFKGIHFHFGPMSEEFQALLLNELGSRGIELSRFVLLPFSLNFQQDLLNRKVAIFLPPFKIPSINLSIEVLACGIPIFAPKDSDHFIIGVQEIGGPGQFYWASIDEMLGILENMNIEKIIHASDMGFHKYVTEHSLNQAAKNFNQFVVWEASNNSSSNLILDLGVEGLIDVEEFVARVF